MPSSSTPPGAHVCVGGDARSFADADEAGAFVGQLARDWHHVVRALVGCEVPVVAAVHGAVAGAGVGLLSACDVAVCAASTRIRPAYIALGFSPDKGRREAWPGRWISCSLTDD